MADLLPSERLQPCLLDRLTDDEPHKQKEGRDQRVVPMRKYRAAVLRDISWLLNTGNLANVMDISEFEEVDRSVLNYGMRDLCGLTASGLDPLEIEERLLRVLRNFEPRVIPHTLSIRSASDPDAHGSSAISFEIEGELWARPLPEPLFIKTEVDLETGDFLIRESGR